jgi:protein-tyrosine-phosphatase
MNRTAFALVFLVGISLLGQTPPKPEVSATTVVFVCEHGAAKSVIAAAYFNKLAAAQGLPYTAVARGTKPDSEVPATIRTDLTSRGLSVPVARPQAVTDEEILRAAKVVSMATDLPATKPAVNPKLVEWNSIPPVGQDYDAARKSIAEQVEELVKSLAPKKKN